MARLKDDCLATGSDLMTLDEALRRLAAGVEPVSEVEEVPLRQARGRFLAGDLVAERDVPPHDNSAVDGYAVFHEDLDADAETRLPVTGRIAAGHPLERPARRGEALRIFTGAPMPEGPDTVFMQEDCRAEDGQVVLAPGIVRGANRRRAGEDVKTGSVIVPRGRRLRAQEIGLAASVGLDRIAVRRRLKTAVFSTGDEVRDPGSPIGPGCVYDANRHGVMALLDGLGCAVTDLGILADDGEAIRQALAGAAPGHDLIITSGGVSLGDEDHVKEAVEALGVLHFWRLAIKPGRPLALGRVGEAAFVGLPGNPVAALVTFMRIARPLAILLAGGTYIDPPLFPVRAGFDLDKKPGRREWMRARLETGADGILTAHAYKAQGSGILASMVEADGLVELAEDRGPVRRGDGVDFLPFKEVSE